LLALLKDEPGADVVERALGREAVMSTVNWAEVLAKLAEEGKESEVTAEDLVNSGVLGEGLSLHPLDEAQAVEIARLRPATRSAGLSLADRACLALASSLDLPALTADRAWGDLELGTRVELIR
jgi:PIN domain nuclease of toxin-antitoxin system